MKKSLGFLALICLLTPIIFIILFFILNFLIFFNPILYSKLIDIYLYTSVILSVLLFIASIIFSVLAIIKNSGRKCAIFVLISIIFIIFVSSPKLYQIYKLNRPSNINYSCIIDSDCEIKNLGNLCGGYPKCVNKNFEPHPPEFNTPFCGFPSIDGCKCVENECKGTLKGELNTLS